VSARVPVVVLGATGSVGERLVERLQAHPWFELVGVTGSPRSVGRGFAEVVGGPDPRGLPWSPEVARLPVLPPEPERLPPAVLAFSALDAEVAGDVERAFAEAGRLVVTNARPHRMDPRVPLLVPEVNPESLALLGEQGFPKGGGLVANPNCSTIGVALALAPLHRAFGVRRLHVTTLQAISGAGKGGLPAWEIQDNVIPFIAGEEEKIEGELGKILGGEPAVSAHCTRVPVTDGHLATLSVAFDVRPSPEEAARVLAEFRGVPQALGLPTAPRRPLHLVTDPAGPQPRKHRGLEGGMGVAVGRVRPCPLLHLRLVVLSHNTVRGAAGGALLCAELAAARGFVPGA
jgi:aspartate-semialdehyde dehydrogenase